MAQLDSRPKNIRCHQQHCTERGHIVGRFQGPFCKYHFDKLTPLKQALVLSIETFSVLEPDSRSRANAIIYQCRNYLSGKEQRKSA